MATRRDELDWLVLLPVIIVGIITTIMVSPMLILLGGVAIASLG